MKNKQKANDRLKAYQVSDGDDQTVIVFETNSASARRNAANEMGCDWEGVDYCRRKPEYDQYAPGPVPAFALIEDGWWFSCHCCGRRVHSDMPGDLEEDDPDALILVPTFSETGVYCSAQCLTDDGLRQRKRQASEAAMLEILDAYWPDHSKRHVHIYDCELVSVKDHDRYYSWADFCLPGLAFRVTWEFGSNQVKVHPNDGDAYRAYMLANPIPKGMLA